MSLLTSLGLKPHARVNDDRRHQTAARLLSKLEQSAWQGLEQELAKASDEYRERLIYGIANFDGAVPLVSRWLDMRPRSAQAHMVLGASLVVGGWKIRGGAYAEQVDEDAWAPFLKMLDDAKAPLQLAADLDKTSADPYAWLIHAELGGAVRRSGAVRQSGGRDKVKSLFRAAVGRSPLHWPAHYKYFVATTQKWGGSHAEMFGFVRAVSNRSPRGNLVHCLVAQAYTEYALAAGPQGRQEIRTRQCASEVATALYAWLDASPATLVEKLLRAGSPFADHAMNHFAVACYLCGAHQEARAVIDALRNEIQTVPWGWIADGARERSDPGFVHDRVRRELESKT
jgi:hypothetical protein